MTLPVAHTDFDDGYELPASDMNDRFGELQTLLTGGLQSDNFRTLGAAKITNTAATRSDSIEQLFVDDMRFSGVIRTRGKLLVENRFFTDGDATPNVAAGSLWQTQNSAGTTITDFQGGVEGQVLIVQIDDENTTIQGSLPVANIVTEAGNDYVNRAPGAGEVRTRYVGFILLNGAWYEAFRSGNTG